VNTFQDNTEGIQTLWSVYLA